MVEEKIKLTQFSHGGGCGCKIAPSILQEILKGSKSKPEFANLLVGNESGDDAAVYELGNGHCLISTTDFFTPIVDDAFNFGRIAAANALSDVYAMGGKPVLALAILGFPVEKIPVEIAQEILKGAKKICEEVSVPLAGGHSIDSSEPIFGLSVNGLVLKEHIKKNNTAREGDLIFLTKPIGTGILSAALKRNLISEAEMKPAIHSMCLLNSMGSIFGTLEYVHAMTDITGFGLLGHLLEMSEGSHLSAQIQYSKIKILKGAEALAKKFIAPDNTFRNWKSYESNVTGINAESLITLCDPQTNGGLLVAVDKRNAGDFIEVLKENGLDDFTDSIGNFFSRQEKAVSVLT